MKLFLQLICASFCVIFAETADLELQKRTWKYTIISVSGNSSNEDQLKWDMKAERIGRGEFGISGTLDLKADLSDQVTEIKSYHSATGGSQYTELPFKVKKQPFREFMAKIYKKYVMEGFATCSNFPQAHGNEDPWFEPKRYIMNKCKIPTDNMPSYIVPGYYKIQAISYGKVNNTFELIVHVENA